MLQIHITNGDFLQAGILQEGYRKATQAEIDAYNLADKKTKYTQATNSEFDYILNNKTVQIQTTAGKQWIVNIKPETYSAIAGIYGTSSLLKPNDVISFGDWSTPNTRIELTKKDIEGYLNAVKNIILCKGQGNIYDARADIVRLIDGCQTLQELETLIFSSKPPSRMPTGVVWYPAPISRLANHRNVSDSTKPTFDKNAWWDIFEVGKRPIQL